MRLIDADAMKKYCIEGLKDSEKELKIVGRYDLAKKMTEDICKDIDEQPTVDLATHDAEIRRQTLKEVESAMYHEAFEVNHDKDGMQKWDGGNWIRYKLFEKVMERLEGGAE